MYRLEDLIQNREDCILCETRDDLGLFIEVCEQNGYHDIVSASIRNSFRVDSADDYPIMFRYDHRLGRLNSLQLRFLASWQNGIGKSQNVYKNVIPLCELLESQYNMENAFDQGILFEMLGVK